MVMPVDDGYDLERERQARRVANEAKLRSLGVASALTDARQAAIAAAVAAPARRKKMPEEAEGRASQRAARATEPVEVRRSTRERREVNYNDDSAFLGLKRAVGRGRGGGGGGGKLPLLDDLTADEIEVMRALQAAKKERGRKRKADDEEDEDDEDEGAGDGGREAKRRGPRDSGKGVRKVGGKVYDSAEGVTCHWCRQKTVGMKVTCTHPTCGRRRMAVTFCGACLYNRHGEDIVAAVASGSWVCPPCRGHCGPGCLLCCNCGPCRKKADLAPTGQIKGFFSKLGYTNAHDYLVGRTTGEDQEALTERKLTMPWAAWMLGEAGEGAAETVEGREQQRPPAEDEEEQHEQGRANTGLRQAEQRLQQDSEAEESEADREDEEEEDEEEPVVEAKGQAARRGSVRGRRGSPKLSACRALAAGRAAAAADSGDAAPDSAVARRRAAAFAAIAAATGLVEQSSDGGSSEDLEGLDAPLARRRKGNPKAKATAGTAGAKAKAAAAASKVKRGAGARIAGRSRSPRNQAIAA